MSLSQALRSRLSAVSSMTSCRAGPVQLVCSVRHARAPTTSKPTERKGSDAVDKRYQVVKEILYGERFKRAPSEVDPQLEQGEEDRLEIIERMWAYEKQQEAVRQVEELKQKYVAMRLAMEELEKTDARLFQEATKTSDDLVMFPKRMKIPTLTPPIGGWDHKPN
ncbi:mitochondrial ribosomal protein L28-domain-containing protein [Polychytrium aggregatum]|uniref:mitochondrial ribosomal protein L28-domain-containing protein n=1 Tax=Polychytrium aggregatum TaxID=110093 RepID=UPI0022FE47BE|nr:mitochondrial ribosomal protein L28-domain-containing protein [Polychytrium aggregatum]KAI9207703.1 mitochondrial ribosomal protein L28-domain-containing protein [Polychytrium aggregatum]